MPRTTIVEIPPAEQARRRAELRRARYGYVLALHLLLLCAAGRTPSEVANVLFCSRSSVYARLCRFHAERFRTRSELRRHQRLRDLVARIRARKQPLGNRE